MLRNDLKQQSTASYLCCIFHNIIVLLHTHVVTKFALPFFGPLFTLSGVLFVFKLFESQSTSIQNLKAPRYNGESRDVLMEFAALGRSSVRHCNIYPDFLYVSVCVHLVRSTTKKIACVKVRPS